MNDRNMQVTAIQPISVVSRGKGRPSAREDLPCPIRDVLDRIGDACSVQVITPLEPEPRPIRCPNHDSEHAAAG